MTPPARIAVSTTLGAAALAALAGCATATDATPAGSSGATSSSGSTSTSSTAKDGTYTESGDYQTPGGTETITVKLTVKSGTVTAVTVSGNPHTPNATRYQQAFESGVSGVVVGKPLSTLKVGAVSGSSLTGNGFNAAVAKIRSDAA